jgi:hydrogenase 3 maturation protease
MAMSPGVERLDRALRSRAVLLAIGNRWCGDDAAGPALIDRVSGRVEIPCIDGGDAPERHLGEATAPAPDSIILLDAVNFGGAPGDVALFRIEDLSSRLGTTHDVPLRTLMHYLSTISGAELILVGIQPGVTAFGADLSAAVSESVDAIADLLIRRYGRARPSCASAAAAACTADEEGGQSHRWT